MKLDYDKSMERGRDGDERGVYDGVEGWVVSIETMKCVRTSLFLCAVFCDGDAKVVCR